MPKGGARVNSGPPPDPNALRRDRKTDKDGWTLLPAEGRPGRVPAWPLVKASRREQAVWTQVWHTPQAVAWERLGWTFDVATYVRLLVAGERGDDIKALSEARQWSDRLGLNPSAMLRNRWRVVEDEVTPRREQRAAAPKRASARDRLKATDGSA